MSRRLRIKLPRFIPERQLEPPENYEQEPKPCEECLLDECLLEKGPRNECDYLDAWLEEQSREYCPRCDAIMTAGHCSHCNATGHFDNPFTPLGEDEQ